jgi:FtsH-binding integral membrane protein
MSQYDQMYQPTPVAALDADVRGAFVTKTYLHLFGAIGAFTLIEVFLFQSGIAYSLAKVLLGGSWLLVLGGFIVVSWLASRVAFTASSLAAQYAALAGFILAEALIFVPLLVLAEMNAEGVIGSAAGITLIGFGALTGVVLYSRKDFSFLRGILMWSGIVALGAIVGAVVFNFNLGAWFSVAMIALAGASILYDTSNVLHHYPEDRYVGAALSLFASVAMMFWYVLRLLMRR